MSGLGFKVKASLVLFLLVLLGCFGPDDDIVYSEYTFNLKFDIQPDGNVYSVGDTVMVRSTIGPTIIDQNTQTAISCGESFLFPLKQGFFQYDTSYTHVDELFTIIPLRGSFGDTQDPVTSMKMWYEIDIASANRELVYYFIPEESGLYTFYLSYSGIDYDDGFLDNDDDWKSERATLEFSINNRAESGYELLEQTEYFDLISKEEHERFGRYTFEVFD